MTEKRRREFHLRDTCGRIIARGVLYDEGNVQILWRTDIGHTAEQYASVSLILDLMPSVQSFHFEEKQMKGLHPFCFRSKDKPSLEVANQIVEMHAADYAIAFISEATGVDLLDVSSVLQKWGLLHRCGAPRLDEKTK